ncbi:MAG: hypothetical protein V2A74_09465 [bacterium]
MKTNVGKIVVSAVIFVVALSLIAPAQVVAPAPALAPNPDFKAVTDKLDPGGTLFLYMNVEDALNRMIDGMETVFLRSGDTQAAAIPAMARGAIKALGVDQVGHIGLSVLPLGGDMSRSKAYLKIAQPTGLFEILGGAPTELASVRFIPPDVVCATSQNINFSKIIPLIDNLTFSVGGPPGQADFRRSLEDIRTREGYDIPALLSSLGTEAAAYLRLDPARLVTIELPSRRSDIDGQMLHESVSVGRPSFLVMVSAKDRTLYDAFVKRLQAQDVLTAPETSIAGFEAQMIRTKENQFGVKPILAYGRNWFFFASDVEELNRALKTADSGGDLRSSQEFKTLAAGLPSKFNGMMFVSPRFSEQFDSFSKQIDSLSQDSNRRGGYYGGAFGHLGIGRDMAEFLGLVNTQGRKSPGRVSMRVNEPGGVMWTAQGDTSPGELLRSTAIAPAAVVSMIALPNMMEAGVRSKVSRARADMRSLATAMEAYYVDNNAYPAWTTDPAKSSRYQRPVEPPIPSFVRKTYQSSVMTLTTPIAYITTLMEDPFAGPKQTFGYYSKSVGNQLGWILFSPGPDGKFDLGWEIYDPSVPQPSLELLTRYTYDPTNGMVSPGDIWRVKQ